MIKKYKLVSYVLTLLLLINVIGTPVSVEAKSVNEVLVTQIDMDTLKIVEDGVVSYLNRINENEIELVTECKSQKITNNSGKLYVDGVYDSSVTYVVPSIKEITMSMNVSAVTPYAETWKTVGTLYWNNAARSLSASLFLSLAITHLRFQTRHLTH